MCDDKIIAFIKQFNCQLMIVTTSFCVSLNNITRTLIIIDYNFQFKTKCVVPRSQVDFFFMFWFAYFIESLSSRLCLLCFVIVVLNIENQLWKKR